MPGLTCARQWPHTPYSFTNATAVDDEREVRRVELYEDEPAVSSRTNRSIVLNARDLALFFKSDDAQTAFIPFFPPLTCALHALKLTETEILTHPHETIANSFKSYCTLADIQDLARRKFLAGAALADLSTDFDVLEDAWVRKKYTDNGRASWDNVSSYEVPAIRCAKRKRE
ncbi:hypothetical protein C8R45DRAFT_1129820 [Mycena sanguinolenta]|nr:hypothetical protein C8R45DRAFT_1129820 [Mycena sanguinolenta]